MTLVRYGLIGFGGIAENRVAKEGFACDRGRFAPHPTAELVAATDVNAARQGAAEALGVSTRSVALELICSVSSFTTFRNRYTGPMLPSYPIFFNSLKIRVPLNSKGSHFQMMICSL